MDRFWKFLCLGCCTVGVLCLGSSPALPQQNQQAPQTRCVSLEIYLHSKQARAAEVLRELNDFVQEYPGTMVTVRDLDGPDARTSQDRLTQIAQHFQFDAANTPIIYGCSQVIVGRHTADQLASRLKALLKLDVYVRTGCPHCQAAERYLEQLRAVYPALQVRYRNIMNDTQARHDLDQVIRKHRQAATSVPVFHFCNQLIVGFDGAATTGRRIEQVLALWTVACRRKPDAKDDGEGQRSPSRPGSWEPLRRQSSLMRRSQSSRISLVSIQRSAAPALSNDEDDTNAREPTDEQSLPVPGDGGGLPIPANPGLPVPGAFDPPLDAMEVPLFGRLSANQLGLPAFTIAVGLVDGFNPCAMWVLLFLLSILVNLKDRWRILAVAGVFVVISGLAYFAFMAAWLNVFLWVGLLRPVQVALALTAIAVGAIHIKDFFAFKQGISLSIPDSAKPGIYARVRRIVTAENLAGAVIGASVLAVMVNIVELLCTAGLPALYTEILALQKLPTWQNYGYLALYNIAYMFDDALMVGIVVITLGRQKMQEKHGRVLKLISGMAILLLGVVMLVKPEWLV